MIVTNCAALNVAAVKKFESDLLASSTMTMSLLSVTVNAFMSEKVIIAAAAAPYQHVVMP